MSDPLAHAALLVPGILVVEGYAPSGSADQQFVASRARAFVAREYLFERFHLDQRSTGVMPLSGGPSEGAPSQPWSGVALTFYFKSK